MAKTYDFSGWATKNDLKCSDGRTIRKNAFKDNDGKTVPLVWQHMHDDPSNVLGHALLENRDTGVYAYCTFNESEPAKQAKMLVQHGDVSALSIYANKLKQDGGNVLHGAIREVSLVLAGANPGAIIDFPVLEHSDGEFEEIDTEAVIFHGDDDEFEFYHAEENTEKEKEMAEEVKEESKDKTIKDVFDSMSEEQKNVVYYMIGQAINDAKSGNAGNEDEGEEEMKHNVFENEMNNEETLSHADIEAIFTDAKRFGSLKDSVLAHSQAYGIEDIDVMFPDARAINNSPDFIKRETAWVAKVMTGTHHTPFSRVKSLHADITADEARAKGYVKGTKKVDEVIAALKRTTTPTTIYKKQKLDRDDIIDITDFDVVSWLKGEMRIMLDEEIARAILVGDGRLASSNDKINELNIRPIWKDDTLYSVPERFAVASNATEDDKAKAFIRKAIKARKDYKGSGNVVLFTTEDMLTDMLLLEDGVGRVIYDTEAKLATALRVKEIITVPVMEGLSREVEGTTYNLDGIIVDLNDYNVGADKGGEVSMFDDFDIDYNQQKYLIETRCSGALTKPHSALILEHSVSA